MRLDLQIVKIRGIRFGKITGVDQGILTLNRDEIAKLLAQDTRFERVEIEIANPGERCRILQVVDVIEPRAKLTPGPGDVLGVAGKHEATGLGKTTVLRGAAVIISDNRDKRGETISSEAHGAIIDMSGPGSEVSPFGQTHNVVVLPLPKKGVSATEYQVALKLAGLKTSNYLAKAACKVAPDDIETYDLPALTEITRGMEDLPKVTYIVQIVSLQFEPLPGEPVLLGQQAAGIVPTILHPNQVLDGAITSPFPGLNIQTYHIQNHPIVKALYDRHGRDLCFAGVIAVVAPNNVFDFDRVANITASLAKGVLGADGAILTKTAGGAPEMAMARTAQRCEQLGIKTTVALMHMGADVKDAKYGGSTIFNMPEVDAIVSMGTPYMELTLPAVERLVGRPGFSPEGPPIDGEIVRSIGAMKGVLCQMGSSKLTSVRY
jgi:glycine reductase complex component B subunit alpha and beta